MIVRGIRLSDIPLPPCGLPLPPCGRLKEMLFKLRSTLKQTKNTYEFTLENNISLTTDFKATYTLDSHYFATFICFQWIQILQHPVECHQVSERNQGQLKITLKRSNNVIKGWTCPLQVKCIGIIYHLLLQVWIADLLTYQLSNSVTLFYCTEDQKCCLHTLIRDFIEDDFYIFHLYQPAIKTPHLSKMQPFSFDKCDIICYTLTLKCFLAKVEEYNPQISSIVFIYNSSCADQIEHQRTGLAFLAHSLQVGRHSPPTSRKYLAANPDLGAEKDEITKHVFVTGKARMAALSRITHPLCHSIHMELLSGCLSSRLPYPQAQQHNHKHYFK